jgi:hypothetical protein
MLQSSTVPLKLRVFKNAPPKEGGAVRLLLVLIR